MGRKPTPRLRVALRLILGLIAIPALPSAIYLFAHHIGSYVNTEGCVTAGSAGMVWAIGEGLSGLIGIGSALLFTFNVWEHEEPDTRRASNVVLGCALGGLAVWAGLLTVIPSIHPCR